MRSMLYQRPLWNFARTRAIDDLAELDVTMCTNEQCFLPRMPLVRQPYELHNYVTSRRYEKKTCSLQLVVRKCINMVVNWMVLLCQLFKIRHQIPSVDHQRSLFMWFFCFCFCHESQWTSFLLVWLMFRNDFTEGSSWVRVRWEVGRGTKFHIDGVLD